MPQRRICRARSDHRTRNRRVLLASADTAYSQTRRNDGYGAGTTDAARSEARTWLPARFRRYRKRNAHRRNSRGGLYSTARDMHRWERALYGDSLASARSKSILFSLRKVITAYGWKTAEEEWAGKKRKVLRTTGGLPGFVNLLLRVPEEERVIILLSNTRGSVYRLDDIAAAINRILDGVPYEKPKRSIAETLAPIIEHSGDGRTRNSSRCKHARPSIY